ncbi:MAG: UvrD-helicase domain-containing protein [Deltaproteobacteria bacterium]|nr:UvrD-helicase domain-containing protein [Deltaproteobacteria bacterium]
MTQSTRIVIAGAGTGKTYTLVESYVECLKRFKPSEILAITFTQKAAAEMRARVISRVQNSGQSARALLSAPICTFHALCAQIVGNAFGDFELLSPYDDQKICLKIAEEVILRSLDNDSVNIGKLVARFQIRQFGDTPGLREVLVSLLQNIREQGLEPKHISYPQVLAQQDQELLKNIRETYEIFRDIKPKGAAQKRLENFGLALTKFHKLYPGEEYIVAAAFRDMRGCLSGRFGNDELRNNLVNAVVAFGSFLCTQATKPDAKALAGLLIEYASQVDIHKRETKQLGFSDLLYFSKQLSHTQQDRFRCILVDEYQDTSPIQEQLIRALSENSELFVVGDPKQSIYGFRGADATVFDRVAGDKESLKLSRRSQGALIEFVNLVAHATIPGFDQTQALEALHEHHGQAGAILKQDWAKKIEELLSESCHPGLDPGSSTGPRLKAGVTCKPNDIVILVRRIKSAYPMAQELQKLGVPVRIEGGDNFYSRLEVSDFSAALYLLIKPEDPYAKLTLMRSPFCDTTDTDLIDWKTYKLPNLFIKLREQLGKIRIAEIIDRLLTDGGYLESLKQDPEKEQKLANIFKLRTLLIDALENYEEKITNLWQMLDRPPKESLAETFSHKEQAVRIMTFHQSKGLEFPVVCLADLASTQPSESSSIAFDPAVGLAVSHKNRPIALCAPQNSTEKKQFPTPIDAVRQKLRSKAEAEVPRLLYVGLTRAKKACYIIDLEQPDRGTSMMRLIKKARESNPKCFDELMPGFNLPTHA